jgi:CheY-like chemotaxis protein
MMPTDENSSLNRAFRAHVRRTLLYLYDPANLRRSPLLDLLGIREGSDKVFTTREVIHKAIQALKPGRTTPGNPTTRQVYQILNYRYLEQMGQKEVAAELAISLRQLQRLESVALDTLSAYLLDAHQIRLEDLNITPELGEDESERDEDPPSPLTKELEWVRQSGQAESANLGSFLEQVLDTTIPLLSSREIRVIVEPTAEEIIVSGNLMALRQGFINIFTALSSTLPPCKLVLSSKVESNRIVTRIRFQDNLEVLPRLDTNEEQTRLAGELFQIASSEMEFLLRDNGEQEIIITIPSKKSLTVLVVDDNSDALALISAYLSDTGFSFHGVTDPNRVLSTAEVIQPDVILLDVMLPGVDGWQILGRIKHHPEMNRIPVVISTILPQAELALSLGADGFLRKPFTLQELQELLENLMQPGPESL